MSSHNYIKNYHFLTSFVISFLRISSVRRSLKAFRCSRVPDSFKHSSITPRTSLDASGENLWLSFFLSNVERIKSITSSNFPVRLQATIRICRIVMYNGVLVSAKISRALSNSFCFNANAATNNWVFRVNGRCTEIYCHWANALCSVSGVFYISYLFNQRKKTKWGVDQWTHYNCNQQFPMK